MKSNTLVDSLYALSAFAKHGCPRDELAEGIMNAAAEAKKMSREVMAYKMAVKSLEAKLDYYRKANK